MSRVVFFSLLVMSSYVGLSQDLKSASVEKSVFGVQIGLLGIWAHHELKLSNQIVLRSEIAMSGVTGDNIEPLIAIEPRWYYNLNKRANKKKRIG